MARTKGTPASSSASPAATPLLPLLQGLTAAAEEEGTTVATSLVAHAVAVWEARQRLRRWWMRHVVHNNKGSRKQASTRPKKKRRREGPTSPTAAAGRTPTTGAPLLHEASASPAANTAHWLWRTLWESPCVSERQAAAHIVRSALETWKKKGDAHNSTASTDLEYWVFGVIRVCVEYHRQTHHGTLVHVTNPQITAEVITSLWTWLRIGGGGGVGTTAKSTTSTTTTNHAFAWACVRGIDLGPFLGQAAWQITATPVVASTTHHPQYKAYLALQHVLWQILVETIDETAVPWYQAIKAHMLWRSVSTTATTTDKPRNDSSGVVTSDNAPWTPLAYLIAAAHIVQSSSGAVASSSSSTTPSNRNSTTNRSSRSNRSGTSSSATTSSTNSDTMDIGVPWDIWQRLTDPWKPNVRIVVPPPQLPPSGPPRPSTATNNPENDNGTAERSSHNENDTTHVDEDQATGVAGGNSQPESLPHEDEEEEEEEEDVVFLDSEDDEDDEEGDMEILDGTGMGNGNVPDAHNGGGGSDHDDEDHEEEEPMRDVDDDENSEDDEEEIMDEEMEFDLDGYVGSLSAVSQSLSNTVRHIASSQGGGTTTEGGPDDAYDAAGKSPLLPPLLERRKTYLGASLQVAASLYPALPPTTSTGNSPVTTTSRSQRRRDFLTTVSENCLWEGMTRVILPPKPSVPPLKIILRRAPTQEEFFRGNLSTNPVDLDFLRRTRQHSAGDENYEPTVGDLRQQIANDLQMGDSAELIEILIANKIVATDLKLRLIHQVVWKQHLMENSTTSGGQSYVSMGSGISMIFSTTRPGGGSLTITPDTPASQLPPMIAVYRLAGVDGEATEDTVDEVADPDAAEEGASPEAREAQMERKFGLTRLVAEGRGFFVLLRSIQFTVEDELRKIRRDQIGLPAGGTNVARETFQNSPPCQGLVLLRHCAKLASNRQRLLQSRAPTVLLTLLLEVLKALSLSGTEQYQNNPTADILQELIEQLTSDISVVASSSTDEVDNGYALLETPDASSMPLLLESIETISLKANLRGVISKLLPFLTYGQSDLSRSLAQHLTEHIDVDELAKCEDEHWHNDSSVMMKTFVETLKALPANGVCNALRAELIHCSLIDRLAQFILRKMPSQPPSWSPALWTKKDMEMISHSGAKKKSLDDAWRLYFNRRGIRTAMQILAGLAKKHNSTQARIATFGSLVQSLHWLEATSDKSILEIETNGLGLLAETLLDEMVEENVEVARLVEGERKKTKLRKREIAHERRRKALGKLSPFGPVVGDTGASAGESSASSTGRETTSSRFGSTILGSFFSGPQGATSKHPPAASSARAAKASKGKGKTNKPAWMTEMESMEEETGITCAICQEGRTLQPSRLLGLYVYITKVSIPMDQCGARSDIDGSALLKSLPPGLPHGLASKGQIKEWFSVGKAVAAGHSATSSHTTTINGKRYSLFITTVTSANAIHVSCHQKAKQADRTHPKAPKSEWEGAKLRNGRVSCNAILPLVSSRSSKVPLMAVDSALSDYQAVVANRLGTSERSSLWSTLFDARFLVLRIAYGEALNLDSGGGSLSSNAALVFHHFTLAEMLEKSSQLENPDASQHVRGLSAAFLSACAIVTDGGSLSAGVRSVLTKGVADAAPMAVLTCILLHNQRDDSGKSDSETDSKPHPNRRWVLGREWFLKGLVIAAGRHKALGISGSGCMTSRKVGKRMRSASFAEWDATDASSDSTDKAKLLPLDAFSKVLRPMLTLFAAFDSLSSHYHGQMDDMAIQTAAESLVTVVETCLQCKNLRELMGYVKVTIPDDELLKLLESGIATAP